MKLMGHSALPVTIWQFSSLHKGDDAETMAGRAGSRLSLHGQLNLGQELLRRRDLWVVQVELLAEASRPMAVLLDIIGGDYSYLDVRDDPYDLENPYSVVRTMEISADGAKLDSTLEALLKAALSEQLASMGYSEDAEDIRVSRCF